MISIEFATTEENHAQFFAQIIVEASADSVTKTATASGDVTIPAVSVVNVPETEGTGAEQIGVTTEQTLAVELPVSWTEDGDVLCYVTFEFNDEKILAHQPVETWKSGKHILSLYYPIEEVVANVTNTFNVYLRMAGGTGAVEIGGCIASISGQSMGAAAAWDGKITIEEKISLFSIGGGIHVKDFAETIETSTREYVIRSYSDVVSGRTAIGAFCTPVDVSSQ